MRQRDRESVTDSEPQGQYFEPPGSPPTPDHAGLPGARRPARPARLRRRRVAARRLRLGRGRRRPRHARRPRPPRRSDDGRRARHTQSRRRRNRRFAVILAALLVLVVAVSAWLIVLPLYHYLNPADYSGAGRGDGHRHRPGRRRRRPDRHDAARPRRRGQRARVHRRGVEQLEVQEHPARLVPAARAHVGRKALSAAAQPELAGERRRPGHRGRDHPRHRAAADRAAVHGEVEPDGRLRPGPEQGRGRRRAFKDVKALGLPTDYTVGGKPPASVEGFLFPATYYFPNKTDASAALQQMISKFTDQARATDFTARAKALRITPVPGADHRLDRAGRGEVPGRLRQGRAGHPQPARRAPAAADRRHQRLRRQAAGPGPEEGQQRRPAVAVQHLPARRPAADPDRQPRRRRDERRRPPGRRQLAVLRQRRRRRAPVLHQQRGRRSIKAVAKCRANHWGCA